MSVKRLDRGELEKPVRLPNGWLRVPARLSRTGIFPYLMPDGSLRREYRPPEEVFNVDSLASFQMNPTTVEHPDNFLDAENTAKHQRGCVGQDVRQDGDFVAATLMFHDREAVEDILSGKRREISCGYTCDLEELPGTVNGESYDCIQRNIRGNHVALVTMGRAGPDVRVRMDAACADVLPNESSSPAAAKPAPASTAPEAPVKFQVRVDGIVFETDNQQLAQAVEQALKKAGDTTAAVQSKLDDAVKQLDTRQAKIDSLTADLAKKDEALKEAPKKVRAEMEARAVLEKKAALVLGDDFKFDGLSDKDIRVAVLEEVDEKLKLDGKSDAYIEARFDSAIENAEKEEHADGADEDEEEERETESIDDAPKGKSKGGRNDADPYEAMKRRNAEAWKPKSA